METYIIIEGFENYSVSDFGNVRNNRTGRILKLGVNKDGYHHVTLMKNKLKHTKKLHRLTAEAFLLNLEKKRDVDHKDNDKANNKLSNLRWATHSENEHNKGISKKNTSNVEGVSFNKKCNKWCARIMIDGISIHLGYFDNLEDAKQARIIKANEVFGVFVNKCEKII